MNPATTHDSAPALAFGDVSAGYGDTEVVRNVDLAVRAGEMLGLVGPNGAGKTTLLRSVTGGARVLCGSVTLAGASARDLAARELARIVSVLPQTVTADAPFSAREFVTMGRHAHQPRFGSATSRDAEVVAHALERTDTDALADEPVNTLSGGDLQRLALAQALAQEPQVLLLDEPTSHLDVNHRLQILDLCRGLADEGMAVLGVFHDFDLAARYADRIAVIADGRLLEDGPPEAVLRPELLQRVFGVRAVVGRDPATQAISVTPILRDEDLSRPTKGRVLVVGGSGHGAWLLGALARDGWHVSLAAVSEGDSDHDVASVLGIPAVVLPPFGQMEGSHETRVAELARAADVVIVSATPFGRANVGNLRAVLAAGTPTVFVGTMDERDYTGGEAADLFECATNAGTRVVDTEADALAAISEVLS